MSDLAPQPQVIPPPPYFPVEWEDPADAQLLWAHGYDYYPTPMTPMGFSLALQPTWVISHERLAAIGLPLRFIPRLINGYVYAAMLPLPNEPFTLVEYSAERLNAMIDGLAERWHATWLPFIEEHLAWWDRFDLQGADMAALLAHLAETEVRAFALEETHGDIATAMFLAVDLFQKTMVDLFPEDGATILHTLLMGFPAEGAQCSQALWQLSRQALAAPTVSAILRTTPTDAVLQRLGESAAGQPFLAEFQAFRQRFGYQSNKDYINQPTLAEDPTLALQTILGYLDQPDRDLAAEAATTVAKREAALAQVRARLASYPQPIVAQFEFLLKAAQEATWLREEHAYRLDMPLNQARRRVVLALGERLQAAGAIDSREDVFYLTPDEIREITATTPYQSCQARVGQRRATEAQFANVAPPPMFGSFVMPSPLPSHPILEAYGQNRANPIPGSATPQALKGTPASAGCVRGTARILRSTEEAGKLKPGDILVTINTVPAWTPLFANLGGLVTVAGGMLSHAAVVAREFGIPAIVGVAGATTLIQDGQLIEVDGSTGVVRLQLD
jgi:phosphohistidine swiveling domain-containing protein